MITKYFNKLYFGIICLIIFAISIVIIASMPDRGDLTTVDIVAICVCTITSLISGTYCFLLLFCPGERFIYKDAKTILITILLLMLTILDIGTVVLFGISTVNLIAVGGLTFIVFELLYLFGDECKSKPNKKLGYNALQKLKALFEAAFIIFSLNGIYLGGQEVAKHWQKIVAVIKQTLNLIIDFIRSYFRWFIIVCVGILILAVIYVAVIAFIKLNIYLKYDVLKRGRR